VGVKGLILSEARRSSNTALSRVPDSYQQTAISLCCENCHWGVCMQRM